MYTSKSSEFSDEKREYKSGINVREELLKLWRASKFANLFIHNLRTIQGFALHKGANEAGTVRIYASENIYLALNSEL